MAGFDETGAGDRRSGSQPSRDAAYTGGERGGLFAGEYRERDVRPSRPDADRQDRSLDAVFSRLAGARDRLPDPRGAGAHDPGLGPVFGRLR